MTSDYAPFPEQELAALATYHDQMAQHATTAWVKGMHEDRAKACRDAVKCHDALRTRFLELRAGLIGVGDAA